MPADVRGAAACEPFDDAPHHVVIELSQPITCAQAQELGRALGAHGFTGRFVGGDVAELARLGAEYRRVLGQGAGGGRG